MAENELPRVLVENAHVIGSALSVIPLWFNARSTKRKMLVEALPTSKVQGVFIGLVELAGTSESDRPLRGFLSSLPCVYYRYTVSEHYVRTRTRTVTDSKGRSRTVTETYSGWETVASGQEMIPFELEDETGRIYIVPEGAEIEGRATFGQTVGRGHPLYYGKGPSGAVYGSTGRRQFSETAIPIDSNITIIGQAVMNPNASKPIIMDAHGVPLYLITTKSEKEIRQAFGTGIWVSGLIALGLPVAGYLIHLNSEGDHSRASTLFGLLAFLAVLLALLVIRCVVVTNGLIDVKNRMKQGYSLLDIQLQRRFDLIPNLVSVVKQATNWEAGLQVRFASTRAYQAARLQFERTAPLVTKIAEAYPNLKSSDQFLKLQRELIDTENRISLARAYLVQIVQNYNTQVEVFPNAILARLIGLRLEEPPTMVDDPSQLEPLRLNPP